MEKTKQEMRDKILKEYKNGNIIIVSVECLQIVKLSDFIKQPIDGLLYDLNRDEATILSFIDDPKWINDYATCKVIRLLSNTCQKRDEIIKAHEDYITFLDDYIGSIAGYLAAHRMLPDNPIVQKGQELRDKITQLKEAIK